MRILLVSVDEYSDMKIVAAFDKDHSAEAAKCAELIDGRIYGEFALNHFQCDDVPEGYSHYIVFIRGDGHVMEPLPRIGPPLEDTGRLRMVGHDITKPSNANTHWRFRVCCFAKSQEHAVKIANDIRVRVIAGALPEREWQNWAPEMEVEEKEQEKDG